MVLSEVEETVTTVEIEEETLEEIIKVSLSVDIRLIGKRGILLRFRDISFHLRMEGCLFSFVKSSNKNMSV